MKGEGLTTKFSGAQMNITYGVERNDFNMTLKIIVFGIIIHKLSEWLQRTSHGIMQMMLAHEYPQALHAALSA